MSEQTINIHSKELATYAKTLRQLLKENAVCEIERKLRKLLTQCANGEIGTGSTDTVLAQIRPAFMDSYFNGATDEEMKIFARIDAGRFFSDSAFAILKKILASGHTESLLRQYSADRASFIQQAEASLKKLEDKGLIKH